jgi:bifunctional DNase/RNase
MYNEITLPVRKRLRGGMQEQHAGGSELMVEMSVESVRINLATNQRVVILREAQSDRYLFIWIANPEAYSIAMELQGTASQRPLTHDLLKSVILELGATLTHVIINDLSEDIFYARLVFDTEGRHAEVDSRPSDAIALAVRMKVPIYVSEKVMDAAAVQLQNVDEEVSPRQRAERNKVDDNLDVFRDFINSLDVLDEFGKQD